MKVTLSWLKQYVAFDWSPDLLAERLTMLGLEVESMSKLGGEFEGIVVAQILTKDRVPGADKLTVCTVNDGAGQRTIICGAQNHNVGDKVPLILPNFTLPLKPGEKEPFVIKERKVFGITSRGMMCSPQELGLPDPVEGLLILPPDAPIGKPFAEYLGRAAGDVLYDLEITPNRPDWNSVMGIAREIAALTRNELKLPNIALGGAGISPGRDQGTARPDSRDAVEELVSVRLDAPDLCPRYTARLIRGLKIGPSPDWLRSLLEKVGLRSISNVVDVTNYVMLEVGQPLHAFDYHLIARGQGGKPTIVVRRARDGEEFITLDGQRHKLTSGNLLIADEEKGIALAGIMGGQNTEINDRTVDVLIESACFNPTSVRRTSKVLGLRTDASYRFERGSDPGICDWASQRCAQLMLETAGGRLAAGVVDAYPTPISPAQITLRHRKVNELLGLELRPEECEYYLSQLGLKILARKPRPVDAENAIPGPVTFQVPTYRVDIKREVDLIEEVARLHGVDKIPSTPPRGARGFNAFDVVHDVIAEARQILTGLGLHEAQGQTLVAKSEVRGVEEEELIALANPLSSDMDVLRPSLLPGLLTILRHNVSRKNGDLGLFEIGRVFRGAVPGQPKREKEKGSISPEAGGAFPGSRRLAVALTGQRQPLFWSGDDRGAKFDVYDLKGLLEEFLERFGVRGLVYAKRSGSTELLLESATIHLGRLQLGELGQLLPPLVRQYDLRDAVFLAELDLDQLVARRGSRKTFRPLPAFPAIRRDVAMVVPEATTHEAVLQAVRQAAPANLESIELFDVFRGRNVPPGQKSMAYALTYRHSERTMTDGEVNSGHEKVLQHLKQRLQATIREQ